MRLGHPLALACTALLTLAGCGAPVGAPAPAVSTVSPTPSPTPTVVAPTDLPASVAASTGATLGVLSDTRSGSALNRPFTYRSVALVNKNHPVSKSFAPSVGKAYRLAPVAEKAFVSMLTAAKADGVAIIWRVGYRDYATQEYLSKNPPSHYGKEADSYVARPGTSEHQVGLAVDVASKAGFGTRFPETKEFAWLRAHAHEYGFILRYPQGKTAITGFNYEPWHYRYVGTAAAAAFGPASTLTLEEYLGGR
ncbi:MAG TPA: hypothetical protein DEG88_02150 [Propionibacteriaceae bacterium]|nr:hypothetical protein [Propionibacteriaceae bacterium]HBY22130.1 hypothetical protein [Propionibacteriaceae bacterium]